MGVHGQRTPHAFHSDRMSMLPYARFLYGSGYNVLLYDDRGTGESAGHFTVGVGEVDDVLGAVDWVSRAHPSAIGLLGVSLGAGAVIVAVAQDRRVRATVADSAYTNQNAVMADLQQLSVGPVHLPLAPVASIVVDRLAHIDIAAFRPIRSISRIAPRPLLLIHSRHDDNPTTGIVKDVLGGCIS